MVDEDEDYFDLDDYENTDCIHACQICPVCHCTCTDDVEDPECDYHTFGKDKNKDLN